MYEPLQPGIYVMSIAFSPNGEMIATGTQDSVGLWNVATGRKIFNKTGHTEIIYAVTFSRDNRLVISGAHDRTIRLWDTNTGEQISTSMMHTKNKVSSISASPDGTKIAAGCTFGVIEVYDTTRWQKLYMLTGDILCAPAPTPVFSPDSQRILASIGKSLQIWDAGTGSKVEVSFGRDLSSKFGFFVISPDGKYFAVSADKTIEIWDATNGALWNKIAHGHQGVLNALTFFPDCTRLVSGARGDHIVKFWDVRSNTQIEPLEKEPKIAPIMTLADVVSSLKLRGCPDMTSQVDMTTCGEYPISSGGFGDIYRCKLRNGIEVAIKTVRIYVGSNDQEKKHLKFACGSRALCVVKMQAYECTATVGVHGDLKGENVLISKDGAPRLSDFGNAKLQEYTMKFTKTSTKETVSSRWAAPELFEGGWCSFETDVYALGMTILVMFHFELTFVEINNLFMQEAITGSMPWPELSERSVIFAVTIKKAHPERPEAHIPVYSDHGDTLWSLLELCWDSDPRNRPNADQVKYGVLISLLNALAACLPIRSKMNGISQDGLKSKDVDMGDIETN
ncbi:Tyrosine kinase family catalytic domain protein [Ceratobasidium sp. AG-Ba]|nr:Tyrosine kinase family catalytic domain protein [Ceratobasidium sp. AG-Ba]